MSEEGTKRPPLVLFGRYGSNNHCAKSTDTSHKFVVAEMSHRRARKVNKKPFYLGGNARGGDLIAREQEEKWVEHAWTSKKTDRSQIS